MYLFTKRKVYFYFIISLVCLFCFFKTEAIFKGDTKSLRLNTPQSRPILDPRQASDITSHSIAQLLYDRLFDVCPDDHLAYSIALSVEKKSPLHYLIHLRKTFWSDGTPLTSADFIRSWLSILNKSCPSPNAHLFFPIKGAKSIYHGSASQEDFGAVAIDDHTIEITLENPHPAFLNLLAFPTFAAIHPSIDLFYQGLLPAEKVVFSGLYTVAHWEKGSLLLLKSNPYHLISKKTLYPSIEFSFIPDPATVVHLLQNGELDLMGGAFTAVPFEWVSSKECLYEHPTGATSLCSFNLNDPLLKLIKLRHALALSIDFHEIIQINPSSLCNIQSTLTPELLYKKLPPEKRIYTHNLSLAKTLLQEALLELNIERLPTITLIHSHLGLQPKIAQVLASQWEQKLGVVVKLQPYDPQTLLFYAANQKFQIALTTLIPQYGDPLAFLERFENQYDATTYAHCFMEDYSSLLKKARNTAHCVERESYYHQLESLLYQSHQIVPLCRWKTRYLHRLEKKCFATLSMGSIHWKTILIPDMKESYVTI